MSVDADEFPEFMARYELWEALYNLGHNLAVAGALTHSFALGYALSRVPGAWLPNTGGRLPPGEKG